MTIGSPACTWNSSDGMKTKLLLQSETRQSFIEGPIQNTPCIEANFNEPLRRLSVELVCSISITETTLFLLNQGLTISWILLSSTYIQYFFPGMLRSLIPYIWNTRSGLILKRGTTVPDCYLMLQRRVSQDSPTKLRDLRYSGWIHHRCLATKELPTT